MQTRVDVAADYILIWFFHVCK